MFSSLSQAYLYVDKIWVKEVEPTTLKVFISHDLPAAVINSIEFAKATDDLDGTLFAVGYPLGSKMTMNDSHWFTPYNNQPKLNNIDVQVKSHSIKDLTNEPWNPKKISMMPIFSDPLKMRKMSTNK